MVKSKILNYLMADLIHFFFVMIILNKVRHTRKLSQYVLNSVVLYILKETNSCNKLTRAFYNDHLSSFYILADLEDI